MSRVTQHHNHNPEPEPEPKAEGNGAPRSYAGVINDDIVIDDPATITGVIHGDVEITAPVTVTGIISGDIVASAPITCRGTISGDIVMMGANITNSGIISGDIKLTDGAQIINTGVVSGDVDRGKSKRASNKGADKRDDDLWQSSTVTIGDAEAAFGPGSVLDGLKDFDLGASFNQFGDMFKNFEIVLEDFDHAPSSSSASSATINGHRFEAADGKLKHNGRLVDAERKNSSGGSIISGKVTKFTLDGFEIEMRANNIAVNGKPIRYT